MQHADDDKFKLTPRPRESQHDVPEPSFGNVIARVGVGCFAIASLLSVAIVAGVAAVWTIVYEYRQSEARDEAAEAAQFSDFEPFKPGDPLPEPPLDLPPPSPPSSRLSIRLGFRDLSEIDDGRGLADYAYQFYQQGEYQAAVQCQYQSVLKTRTGYYNLACFYALAKDVPAALFWLQVSAKEEVANAQWASKDEDLVDVRKNPRWPILLNYLTAYESHWEKTGKAETTLILPRNATAGQPLPVFIGLHATGDNAHNFINADMFQHLADQMGVAFLGVSGTLCRGKESFVWSEDPEQDLARIDAAMQEQEVVEKLTPAEGKAVLFGFSQGASVAVELAARHPSRFAGAILLSPSADSEIKLEQWQGQPENQRQGIVAVCGAEESPETVARTNQIAAKFKSLGARVSLKVYPGMKGRSLPPGFVQRFPGWGRFILDSDALVAEPQVRPRGRRVLPPTF